MMRGLYISTTTVLNAFSPILLDTVFLLSKEDEIYLTAKKLEELLGIPRSTASKILSFISRNYEIVEGRFGKYRIKREERSYLLVRVKKVRT